MPDKVAQQNPTEIEEKFVPTTAMLKWFDAAVELGYTASITEVSKHSKVDRTMWYEFLKKPGFVGWWDSKWQEHLQVNRWKLDAIGMKNAERNYDYWHDMMQRTGNLSTQDAAGNMTQVNINLDSYMK